MERLSDFLGTVEGWVWGLPLIILLFGTHLFLTVRLGFIQRYIGKMIRLSFVTKKEGEGDVHHFGALTTAMASTVGTGNIIGVAGAILLGGPGALVWMWLTGVFGIATKYGEAVLAIKFRQVGEKGQMYGGPMYVLEHGMNMKWLGIIFAALTAIAAFGIGNAVQTFTLADIVEKNFGVAHWITGGIVAVLTALVILGGIKSISKVCQGLVPLMVIVYVLSCFVILLMNAGAILPAIGLIVSEAFSPSAVTGGFLGSLFIVIQAGVARGLFSNEAGLGSAPMVAAAAQTPNPVRQALVSASATFWDTVVICLITGLTFVVSGAYGEVQAMGGAGDANMVADIAFRGIPGVGSILLVIALGTFVFSTILGWSYYGEVAMEYLFGEKSIIFYRIAWIAAVFLFALTKIGVVWAFAGIMNGLMAIPNLIALLALSGLIVSETRRFINEPDEGMPEVDVKSQP